MTLSKVEAALEAAIATISVCDKIGATPALEKLAESRAIHGLAGHVAGPCAVAGPTPQTPTNAHPSAPVAAPLTSSPLSASYEITKTLQAQVNGFPDPYTKRWRDLWKHETLAVAYDAVQSLNGMAFTLRFNKQVEARLCAHHAPVDYLRRNINWELKKALGYLPAYSFTFEIGDAGRLHVHGVIVPVDGDNERPRLKAALAAAGGKITGRGAARQVEFKPLFYGRGWAVYSLAGYDDACRLFGTHKITFIATELTRAAKAHHEANLI